MNMSAEPATTGTDKPDPYRIVIVEDDRSQALFAEAILRGAGMLAEVVSAPERLMATMEQFSPDLVLMDLHMPGTSGTTLTVQIREHPRFEQTPVVFLTGDQDPERQVEVLELGADDFILKPVRPRHLIAAVQSRVRRARAAQTRTVVSESDHHPVTGLFTRPALMQKLGASIPATTGGALLVEMGNAVALRNRYGYAGFESLMNDAGRLLGTIAKGQSAARLSDNAFLVVVPELDASQLETYARSLRDGIGYHDFHVDQESLRLRCAIGHTALAHGFADAGSVLAAAEEAVRSAREQTIGIAAYVPQADVAPPIDGIAEALRASLSGEADLIHLAFQPVVAVAGGEDAQFQVLVRMRDAQGTEQMARDFLPAAEASGLLPALDRWVMERALVLLQKRRAESKPMRLFVSQSPRTLAQDAYAGWLVQALEQSSVEGTWLVLDIRLDDALVHSMLLRQFCERMVPAGVQFCLSQYRHSVDADLLLQQLPLGYVRLAADFARQPLPPERRDEMRGVIDRAHRLGLQVIGQGVEDPQAAAALWMGGIDFIQGNLVQRAEQALDFDFQHATL